MSMTVKGAGEPAATSEREAGGQRGGSSTGSLDAGAAAMNTTAASATPAMAILIRG